MKSAKSPQPSSPPRPRKAVTESALDVLDVVPPVMDVLRATMRERLPERRSVPQYRCLGYITRHPGSAMGDVATFLGVTMATASAMVDRLVRDGLVETEVDPQDRRRVRLAASASGHAELEGVRALALEDIERQLGQLPAAQLKTLREGLGVLRDAFLESGAPA